jgi:hypothetical protein
MDPRRGRITLTIGLGLAVGLVIGAMAIGPATADFQNNVNHLYGHFKDKVNRQIVEAATVENSTDAFKSKSVECPGNTRVLGGGAHIGGADFDFEPSGPVGLMASAPFSGGAKWRASAREMSSTSASWNLTVYAICGNL